MIHLCDLFESTVVCRLRAQHPSTGLFTGTLRFYVSRLGGKKIRLCLGCGFDRVTIPVSGVRLAIIELLLLKFCLSTMKILDPSHAARSYLLNLLCGERPIDSNPRNVCSQLNGSHGEWTDDDDLAAVLPDVRCVTCDCTLINRFPGARAGAPEKAKHTHTHFALGCDGGHDAFMCIGCAANIYVAGVTRDVNPENDSCIRCPQCRIAFNTKGSFLIPWFGNPGADNITPLTIFRQKLLARRYPPAGPPAYVAYLVQALTTAIGRLGNNQALIHQGHQLANPVPPLPANHIRFNGAPRPPPRPGVPAAPAVAAAAPPRLPAAAAPPAIAAGPPAVVNAGPPAVIPPHHLRIALMAAIVAANGRAQPRLPAARNPPALNAPAVVDEDPPPHFDPPPPNNPNDRNMFNTEFTSLYTQENFLSGSIWDMDMLSIGIVWFLTLLLTIGKGRWFPLVLFPLIYNRVIEVDRKHLKIAVSIVVVLPLVLYTMLDSSVDGHEIPTLKDYFLEVLWFSKRMIRYYLFLMEGQFSLLGFLGYLFNFRNTIALVMIGFFMYPILWSVRKRNRGRIGLSSSDIIGQPLWLPHFRWHRLDIGLYIPELISFGGDHLPPNLRKGSPYTGWIPDASIYSELYRKCLPSRYANSATSGLLRYIGGDIQNIITTAEIPLDQFDPIILLNTGTAIHQAVLTVRFANERNNSHEGLEGVRDLQW